MTIQADFSIPYPPSQAEDAKFVVLDPLTIPNYPATYTDSYTGSAIPTNGKVAILTYETNPSNLILSSGNVTVSSVIVTNPLTIGTINDTITVDTIQSTISTMEMLPTTTALICSVTLTTNTSSSFTFNPVITLLEIYNNSSNKIYFNYNGGTTFNDVINKGMVIDGDSYYAIEKNVSGLVVASVSGADVRIFGHRR